MCNCRKLCMALVPFDLKGSILPPLCAVIKKGTRALELPPCHVFPLISNVCFCCVLHKSLLAPSAAKVGKIPLVLLEEIELCCLCVFTAAYEKQFNRCQKQHYFHFFFHEDKALALLFVPAQCTAVHCIASRWWASFKFPQLACAGPTHCACSPVT